MNGAVPGPAPLDAAALRTAVDRYFEALDALDVDAVVEQFAPGGSLLCVTDGRAPRGHDELRAFFEVVCGGSRGMVHPVLWAAVDVAARRVAVHLHYRDEREGGAVYDEQTCNLFELDEQGRLARVLFWRGR